MKRTVILVDDNKDFIESLSNALLQDFEVVCIAKSFADSLRKVLSILASDETVILLNVNLEVKGVDRRSEYKGIMLLEDCVRLGCRSLIPVVLTSYESWEKFKDNPHNGIVLEPGHHYYQYPPRIPKLIQVLKEARPIYNEAALDEVIRRACSLLSKIKTELHSVENSLVIQRQFDILRKNTLPRIERLKRLVSARYHEECYLLQLEDRLRQLSSIDDREIIEDTLSRFKLRASQLFG